MAKRNPNHWGKDLEKTFEALGINLPGNIIKAIQKWFDEEILPYIGNVKYKRDEHEAINTGITAHAEEYLKKIICPIIPRWMGPDILTLIGIIGNFIVALGYYFGYKDRDMLILVILGLVVNWFGDSFDGSIARYWNRTRPNYGYYIDHIIDGISVFVMSLGLGCSGFVRIDIALIFAIAYLLLETHVLLVKTVENKFAYTFGLIGPTEFRIIMSFFTIYLYFSKSIKVFASISQYDTFILFLITAMIITLITSIIKEALKLHKQDVKMWGVKNPS